MKFPLTAAAAAALCICSAASAAGPELKFSAFGTVAATHSDTKNTDYVSDIFQPAGAGHTRSWSFDPDTRLGGQLSAVFNEQFSAVVQVVSKHQYDSTFKPAIEWANVKYQITPALSVRLGRIAAPSYLLSESRFVGYSMPWVRPPVEAYGVLSITSNDGVDATWRQQFGSVNNTTQVYWGKSTAKLSSGKVKSDPAWGINNSAEIGSLTLRAGYTSLTVNLDIPSTQPLFGGLQQFAAGAANFGAPGVAAQALALAEKYKLSDMTLKATSLGASYDPGAWFLMGELVEFKGDGFLSDSRSFYVSTGYRFGTVTPYVAYSSTKAKVEREAGIDTTGAAPLAAGAAGLTAGINASLYSFTPTQKTASVGVRWDFMSNLALKAQYDSVRIGDLSNGRLKTFTGLTPEKRADVVTVAVDFVF